MRKILNTKFIMENSLVVLKKKSFIDKLIDGVLIIITAISCIIFALCIVIIIQKIVFPDRIPNLFGIKPFIVLTDSMKPEIVSGDLAMIKNVKVKSLKEGDIIAFRNTEDDSVTLHRITEVKKDNNIISFRTKGDNNNSEDKRDVKLENIEGIYFNRIKYLGKISMFIRSPEGILLFLLVIFLIFLIIQFIKIKIQKKELNNRVKEYIEIIEEMKKGVN